MFVKLQFVIIFVITCTIVFTMTVMTCASGGQVRSGASGQGPRRSRWGRGSSGKACVAEWAGRVHEKNDAENQKPVIQFSRLYSSIPDHEA